MAIFMALDLVAASVSCSGKRRDFTAGRAMRRDFGLRTATTPPLQERVIAQLWHVSHMPPEIIGRVPLDPRSTRDLMNQAVSGADAVLEIELNARELLALNRLRAPGRTRLFPRIVAGLGAAGCFAMLIAMLVSNRMADVGQRTPAWVGKIATTLPAIAETVLPGSEAAPAATATTVRFANPFDRAEIFEFPAGTSTEEAQ